MYSINNFIHFYFANFLCRLIWWTNELNSRTDLFIPWSLTVIRKFANNWKSAPHLRGKSGNGIWKCFFKCSFFKKKSFLPLAEGLRLRAKLWNFFHLKRYSFLSYQIFFTLTVMTYWLKMNIFITCVKTSSEYIYL